MNQENIYNPLIAKRFRGFYPVVVDIETAGFNAQTDAMLEIAAVLLDMDENQSFYIKQTVHTHVEAFAGANIDPKAIAFNGIDPDHPFRDAMAENQALKHIFGPVRQAVKQSGCKRAILVGHNAFFDLGFLNAAVQRCEFKRNPFHPFSTLDTVSLAALAYGQTVLATAAEAAGLPWDNKQAHSAVYDAEQTARLFCTIVNQNKLLLA